MAKEVKCGHDIGLKACPPPLCVENRVLIGGTFSGCRCRKSYIIKYNILTLFEICFACYVFFQSINRVASSRKTVNAVTVLKPTIQFSKC